MDWVGKMEQLKIIEPDHSQFLIKHIDNLEFVNSIEDKSVQLVVTSPPYNIGKAYEKKVEALVEELKPKDVVEVLHNPWFGYRDDHGLGYAQPDYIIRTPGRIYILECKLSQNLQAIAQLKLLYLPLIRQYYKQPIVLIQVFKYINSLSGLLLIHTLEEAKPNERIYTIHWLGT